MEHKKIFYRITCECGKMISIPANQQVKRLYCKNCKKDIIHLYYKNKRFINSILAKNNTDLKSRWEIIDIYNIAQNVLQYFLNKNITNFDEHYSIQLDINYKRIDRKIIDMFGLYIALVQSYSFENEYDEKMSEVTKEAAELVIKLYIKYFLHSWNTHIYEFLTEFYMFEDYKVLLYILESMNKRDLKDKIIDMKNKYDKLLTQRFEIYNQIEKIGHKQRQILIKINEYKEKINKGNKSLKTNPELRLQIQGFLDIYNSELQKLNQKYNEIKEKIYTLNMKENNLRMEVGLIQKKANHIAENLIDEYEQFLAKLTTKQSLEHDRQIFYYAYIDSLDVKKLTYIKEKIDTYERESDIDYYVKTGDYIPIYNTRLYYYCLFGLDVSNFTLPSQNEIIKFLEIIRDSAHHNNLYLFETLDLPPYVDYTTEQGFFVYLMRTPETEFIYEVKSVVEIFEILLDILSKDAFSISLKQIIMSYNLEEIALYLKKLKEELF